MNWASLSTISGLLKNNIGEVRISRPWPSIMLTTLVLATSANIAQGETIFDAIGSVTKSHPAVIAATKLMAAANSERREAISGYMPTLSIDGRTGQQSRDRISGNTSLYSNELSLSLRQPLFDGFKTRNAVRAAGAAEAEAKSEMEMRTLRVAFEAARTYIDVLEQTNSRLRQAPIVSASTTWLKGSASAPMLTRGCGRISLLANPGSWKQIFSSRPLKADGSLRPTAIGNCSANRQRPESGKPRKSGHTEIQRTGAVDRTEDTSGCEDGTCCHRAPVGADRCGAL